MVIFMCGKYVESLFKINLEIWPFSHHPIFPLLLLLSLPIFLQSFRAGSRSYFLFLLLRAFQEGLAIIIIAP